MGQTFYISNTAYSGIVAGADLDNYFIPKELFVSGNLLATGNNALGQLGDNTTVGRSSPVQVIGGGLNWKSVSASNSASFAVKTDGTLWTWGLNTSGQLGINTVTSRSSPGQTISATANWLNVGAGNNHVAAIKTDGTLWTWGLNTDGQLGASSTVNRSSPGQTVATGTNWRQVKAGNAHTVALKTDGSLWTWGLNTFGQLGDGTTVSKSSPIQIGLFSWKVIAAGFNTSGAVRAEYVSGAGFTTDGTLWMWGRNDFAQLGSNVGDKSSPIQMISPSNNWKFVDISPAGVASAGIKTDGTLWTWGNNSDGILGDFTTINRLSPVQTVIRTNDWKEVRLGSRHAIARKTDGTVYGWGNNTFGAASTSNATSQLLIPVRMGINNCKSLAAGNAHNIFVLDNDTGINFTANANSGEALFTTPGSFTWVAPTGVTSVCVVCVGGGGSGSIPGSGSVSIGGGGGGGGLGWKNNISVTPGNSYNVVVGAGGASVSTLSPGLDGNDGGNSYFINTSTVFGEGGKKGVSQSAPGGPGAGGTYIGDGGGNGGAGGGDQTTANEAKSGGGGGAGGYSGPGGTGGFGRGDFGIPGTQPTEGQWGGGGGGAAIFGSFVGNGNACGAGAGGGGVGLYGQGINGKAENNLEWVGFTINAPYYPLGGRGGSAGQSGANGLVGFAFANIGGNGGLYGGGGAGATGVGQGGGPTITSGTGANGAVRIIWGTNRAFPNTNVFAI